MANVKKGQLVKPPQWWKHLKPYWKRMFWKKNRQKEKELIKNEYN